MTHINSLSRWLLSIAFVISSHTAFAKDVIIDITQGNDRGIRIAVAPFANNVNSLDLAAIVRNDLASSGQIEALPVDSFLSLPRPGDKIYFRDWALIKAEYLVVGQVTAGSPGTSTLRYELYDVHTQKTLMQRGLKLSDKKLRAGSHKISDDVYQKLTGLQGAYSTKLAFVKVTTKPKRQYQLMISDSDGHNAHVLLTSKEPILSPAWSHKGDQLAYTSFEKGYPVVYRQHLATGQRHTVSDSAGINTSPTWAPDDSAIALVKANKQKAKIHLVDLNNNTSRAITRGSFNTDGEPVFHPDGKSIFYTSNRGGNTQIYRAYLNSNKVERITYEGRSNARPSISRNGKTLAFIHQGSDKKFSIASFNLDTQALRVLSKSHDDDAPSIAPNGAMVVYGTQHQGKGVLALVSIDTGQQTFLPSISGARIREPAWSPYLSRADRAQ